MRYNTLARVEGCIMNELVKYDNYLNAVSFKGFTATDYDFLMYLCAQMRDCNDDVMTFSLNEIKTATGYDYHISNAKFADILDGMNDKLINIKAKVRKGLHSKTMVLFPTFDADGDANTLTVRVNPDFRFLLNELTKNFTQFELQEFTELNSKYSKTLYRLLKQFRSTGEYHVKADELYRLLGCPESYDNRKIMQKIINPTIKELQREFPTLSCEPVRARTKGRPITGYHFTFEVDGQIPGQTTLDQAVEEMKRYKASKARAKAKNAFNDFEQRSYDYADLERRLVSRSTVQDTDQDTK